MHLVIEVIKINFQPNKLIADVLPALECKRMSNYPEVVVELLHYENIPMQYLVYFHGCKIDNFQMKNCDIFLIFAKNIDCGCTLEPPH